MKKRNLVLRTAVAAALVSLFAGATANAAVSVTTTSPTKYATEVFKGSAPNTSVIVPVTTAISSVGIGSGATFTVVFQLTNGATWDSSLSASNSFASSVGGTVAVNYVNSGGATVTTSSAGVASNADVAVVSVTTSTSAVAIGSGSVVTVSTNKIHASALAAPGSIGVTATTYSGALSALPAAGTVPLDATSVAATITSSIVGIALAGSPTASGSQKIDLTSSPTGTQFITTAGVRSNVATLGNITATLNSGSATKADPTAAYALATKYVSVNLVGSAGVFTAMNSTKKAWLETGACTAGAGSALAGTATSFASAAAAAAATTLNLASTAVLVSGSSYNVCMEVDGVTSIVPGTISASATLGVAGVQDQSQTLSTISLLTLGLNGSQRDVRSYIPAGSVGYTSFVRTINTGSVTAAVTGQWLYENGTTSTPATLIASLVGGASSTLSSAQVEAVLGAPTVIGSNRPRLRLSAPTNGLDIQSFFLTNATGNFSDVTGAQ